MINDELVESETLRLVISSDDRFGVDYLKSDFTSTAENNIIYDSLTATDIIYDKLQ